MSAGFLLPVFLCMVLTIGCAKREAAESEVLTFDDDTFQASIDAGLVLVDFWATWCPPCKQQGPIVEALARQVKGFATIAKVDYDKALGTVRHYRIEALPTLILFKDGKQVKQFVGLTQGKVLLAAIQAER